MRPAELEFLQLGGHDDLVPVAPRSIPARKGICVETIELFVIMERVVMEEQEALCLCAPSEGEHVVEA